MLWTRLELADKLERGKVRNIAHSYIDVPSNCCVIRTKLILILISLQFQGIFLQSENKGRFLLELYESKKYLRLHFDLGPMVCRLRFKVR